MGWRWVNQAQRPRQVTSGSRNLRVVSGCSTQERGWHNWHNWRNANPPGQEGPTGGVSVQPRRRTTPPASRAKETRASAKRLAMLLGAPRLATTTGGRGARWLPTVAMRQIRWASLSKSLRGRAASSTGMCPR